MKGNAQHVRARSASVHGFSLHANTAIPAHRRDQLERSSAIPPVVPCPWTASRKMPTVTSSTPSPIHGPTAPRGFASRRWNSWRSWRRWFPCPTSIWCAMGAASRRTATCVGQSSPPHVSKASTSRRRAPRRRAGAGHGCSSGCLTWIWLRCPFCQRGTLRLIAVITQGEVIRKILRHLKRSVDHPPSRLPVLAKHRSTGWPKPTPARGVPLALCAP